LWAFRSSFKVPGQLFSLYLLLNGFERLLIEQIRVNNTFSFLGLEVTQAMVIASALIIAGLIGLLAVKKIAPPHVQSGS
ncbi:MAG: prolipoprotein diacylglyceryl transferase family protein, partial [Bacteroidota bacterium]